MIKDNNAPQEQSAREEIHPVSLDHEDLEASEMESISGGKPENHNFTSTVECCCGGMNPTW